MKKFALIAACAIQMCDIYGMFKTDHELYACMCKFQSIIRHYTLSNGIPSGNSQQKWVRGLFDGLARYEDCEKTINFWHSLNVDQSWNLQTIMCDILCAQQRNDELLLIQLNHVFFEQIEDIPSSVNHASYSDLSAAQIALLDIFLKICGIEPDTRKTIVVSVSQL